MKNSGNNYSPMDNYRPLLSNTINLMRRSYSFFEVREF